MSTIDATISMMQGMTEASQMKVLDYVKLVYREETAPGPFEPLSAEEILDKLAIGRAQNQAGEGIPFDEAMRRIGRENGFI